MPRIKKLKDLEQTHGKIEDENNNHDDNKFIPRTLDQVWGDDGLWKYNTMDVQDYKQKLSEMNGADIRNEAIKRGIVPIPNRERLVKRLISEFNKHVAAYQFRPGPAPQKKVSKAVIDIMAEAK